MTVLAFCAAATKTIRFGTALAVLPMRDPCWLAKQAATLDQLSDGRLILGLGIGAYREEFAAWGPRLAADARRGEMLNEGLGLICRLLTQAHVTHEGLLCLPEHRDVSRAQAEPLCTVDRRA